MKVTDEMIDALTDAALTYNWEHMPVERIHARWREALAATFGSLPEPTATVVELNKRVTALQQRLERVRAVLDMTRKFTPEVSAMCDQLARALSGDEP